MNVTPAYYLCSTGLATVESNFTTYTGCQLKGTDHVGTFIGLKCVVYYANYRSGNQSSKIQVVT